MQIREFRALKSFDIEIGNASLAIVGGEHNLDVPTLFVEDDLGVLTATYGSNGQLKVRKQRVVPGHKPKVALEVPRGYRLGINTAMIIGGEVVVQGVNAEFLRVTSATGSIALRNSHLDGISGSARKTNVEVQNVSTRGTADIQIDEGDILVEGSQAKTWQLQTNLGSITTRRVQGDVYATAPRGSIVRG